MIDFEEYIKSVAGGQQIVELRNGMETARVIRVGDWVYKLRCHNIDVERVELHNKCFGDTTGYEILGEAQSCGNTGVLLKQPYIDIIPNSNVSGQRLLTMDLLVKHGRVLAVKDELWADGILFDNLGFGNVGVNMVTGNYAVVDCLISKWSEKNVRDLWGRNRFVVNEFTMQLVGAGGGEEGVWIVWRGWWNDSD